MLDIINGIKKQDKLEIERFIRMYEHKVYGLILRDVGDSKLALELTGEVFNDAIKKIRETKEIKKSIDSILIEIIMKRLKKLR